MHKYAPLIVVKFENDKIPAFVENKNGRVKWVKYGETNNYPQFLTTLFNRSAKHNAICTDKQLYIAGKGWDFDSNDMQDADTIKLKAFVDNPNPYETLNDLMKKTALDELLYGGFYLKVVHNKKGEMAELYHVDYNTVRSNRDNSEFYVSEYWLDESGNERTNLKPDEYETHPAYSPDKNKGVCIYYYKTYRPGLRTYTLPEYIGAIPAIITDAEIANFHRAEIQNGFKGSRMIVFKNGVPSDEEMKSTERRLKNKFTDTDAAGSMVIDFVDDPNRVPEILPLNGDDFDKRYDALNKTIQEEIFVGHKVTSPMLFGVRVEGQLGGRNEMVDAFNLFQNKYISPKQDIQEMVYNYFAPVKGKLKIKPIEPIMPSFSEATLMQIMTKDELREVIGRKPLDKSVVLNNTITDALNAVSPLVGTKILNTLTQNEIRGIINLPPIPGGDVPAGSVPTDVAASQFDIDLKKYDIPADDEVDFAIFSKYGEPIENFTSVKMRKYMMSSQQFALTKLEQGVLDLIVKTPEITEDALIKILESNKTDIKAALETLLAEGLIKVGDTITPTSKGEKKEIPSFEDLFIRYRYVERPDAPPLKGQSRPFCKAMISNPRYFSKEDIDNISTELGQIYGIPDYDAFKQRGGWYHDPKTGTNVPYCRHIWQQELVKRAR